MAVKALRAETEARVAVRELRRPEEEAETVAPVAREEVDPAEGLHPQTHQATHPRTLHREEEPIHHILQKTQPSQLKETRELQEALHRTAEHRKVEVVEV